jgi:hypothetical protein
MAPIVGDIGAVVETARRSCRRAGGAGQGRAATTAISISTSRGRRATSTVARAGGWL